jgi:hypothetical protein
MSSLFTRKHGGIYYIAQRNPRAGPPYLWSTMPTSLDVDHTRINARQVPRTIRRAAYRTLDKLLPCLALAVLLFSGTAQSQPCTSERIIREDGSHWDRVICPPPQSAPGEPVCHSGTLVVPCSPDYDPNYASTKPLTPKQTREYRLLISAGITKKDAKRVVRDPGVKKGEWGWDCDNKTAVRVRGAGAKYGSNVVCE